MLLGAVSLDLPFRTLHQPHDVAAVADENEHHDRSRPRKIRPPSPCECQQRHCEDHHDDRADRCSLPNDEDDNPDHGERHTNSRCKYDETTKRRRDGFSTPKPMEDREGVTDHRSEQGHVPERRIDDPYPDRCGEHPFARIANENEATEFLPEYPYDVRRAGVARPDGVDIDTLTPSHKHTETDAPKQVREHDGNNLIHADKCRSYRPAFCLVDNLLPIGSLKRYGGAVLWLSRPPYLRWIAAGAIVLAALVWDLSKRQSESFPFAATAILAGTAITEDLIEWRPLPEGSVPVPLLSGVSATADIDAGDPLTRSVLSQTSQLPEGWWSIPIDIPYGIPVGAAIRVVLPDGSAATGVVTQPASNDGFGVPSPGTVGFPAAVADTVAQLVSVGDVVILVEP